MSTEASNQQSGPAFSLHLDAAVGNGRVHFSTTSLEELAKVMAYFNLGVTIEKKDAKADKKDKGDKGNAPASTAPAAAGSSPSPAASPAPAASAPSGDVIDQPKAAEAVRAYGAKFGIDKARELLKKHGFEKTGEITAEKAPAVHAEAVAATAAQDL